MCAHNLFGVFSWRVAGVAVLAFVLLLSCDFANAALAYEAFSYPDEHLKGCNGGVDWMRAWSAEGHDTQAAAVATPLQYTFPIGHIVAGGSIAMLLDHDTPDLMTYTTGPTVSKIGSIGFANSQRRNDTICIDEVLLGTTWSGEVHGQDKPVPAIATAGLLPAGGLSHRWRNCHTGESSSNELTTGIILLSMSWARCF